METTFPDRCFLLIISILIVSGCGSKKEYEIDPVPVLRQVIAIDSFYTTTEYVPTGGGNYLFAGIKGAFDSYALMRFDTIPESFDSVFIQLKADSTLCLLSFYQIIDEWYEDSLYKWEDIGELIDTFTVLQTSLVDTINPEIKLDSLSVNLINENGIAVHSNAFYSFDARERGVNNEPKLIVYQGDTTYNLSCGKDLYLVKNPFDSLKKDTLLVGRGVYIKSHLFIPVDSLPLNRNNYARAGLNFEVEEQLSFDLIAYDSSGNEYSGYYAEGDTNFIEFDLKKLLESDISNDYLHVMIEALNVLGGIDVLGFSENKLKLMWVELGTK